MSDLKTSAKNTDTHTQENVAKKKKRNRTHSRKTRSEKTGQILGSRKENTPKFPRSEI